MLEGVSDQDEIDLQNHLREKYPNLYNEENTPKSEKTSTKKNEKLTNADATPPNDEEKIENHSLENQKVAETNTPEIKEESAKNN